MITYEVRAARLFKSGTNPPEMRGYTPMIFEIEDGRIKRQVAFAFIPMPGGVIPPSNSHSVPIDDQPIFKTPEAAMKAYLKTKPKGIPEPSIIPGYGYLLKVYPKGQARYRSKVLGDLSKWSAQSLVDQLVGNILVRDWGEDVYERESLKREIAKRLDRQEFSIDPLLELLKHDDWAVRDEVAFVLGFSKDAKAVKPLIEAMVKDESRSVQRNAALALERLGIPEALAIVKEWHREEGSTDYDDGGQGLWKGTPK